MSLRTSRAVRQHRTLKAALPRSHPPTAGSSTPKSCLPISEPKPSASSCRRSGIAGTQEIRQHNSEIQSLPTILPPMRHPHHQRRNPLLLRPRHHPAIADPPSPVSRLIPRLRTAQRPRVVERGDALFHCLDDLRRQRAAARRVKDAAPGPLPCAARAR